MEVNRYPTNGGTFPTLIALIALFFVGATAGFFQSLLSTLILTGVIVLGVLLTFGVSRFLSATFLKGEASSFTLELPPYRTPQIGKVIVRSLLDRTVFVLGRAAAVAAPAGLLLWILANVMVGDASLLSHCAGFLDPFARLLGMDGVILLAFILGFPANEIVVPIMLMTYLSTGTILEMGSLTELKTLLVANGWTWTTAVSTMLFCLVHWPCSTTCLTIRKETGSAKWTALAVLLPTGIGLLVCFLFAGVVRLVGLF
jgi:ferrous iron transport protein B